MSTTQIPIESRVLRVSLLSVFSTQFIDFTGPCADAPHPEPSAGDPGPHGGGSGPGARALTPPPGPSASGPRLLSDFGRHWIRTDLSLVNKPQ